MLMTWPCNHSATNTFILPPIPSPFSLLLFTLVGSCLHHAAFLFPVTGTSFRCSVRWSFVESHLRQACSCLRDLVGYCIVPERSFRSALCVVLYKCWGCGGLFCTVVVFLVLQLKGAQVDTDSAPAMATTTTHSWILACTAMIFFLLISTSIPRAQGRVLRGCPCGETYVVRGGESLQMISEKCNDQFILENNPHIVDHDDLFEGQFLKMDCTQRKINLCDITGALPAYFC